MAARLGNVVYWGACIFAALALAWAALNAAAVWFGSPAADVNTREMLIALALAVLAWLVGWTVRYVLAAK